MKLPKTPPDLEAALSRAFAGGGDLGHLLASPAYSALADGRYLPWDELRFRPLPAGIPNHDAWWVAVKLARTAQYRALPFLDTEGRPFVLASPDPLQQVLSEIDRNLSGRVALADALTNPASRDRYVFSALAEEAITSSQLEGASTTAKVAREMLRSGRPPRDRHERMIFNNFAAMQLVRRLAKDPLTPEVVCELHARLSEGTLDDPSDSGRLRPGPVHVIVDGGLVVHDPPPAHELALRMQRLCTFANEAAPEFCVHPIVRAILLHMTLGYDHPFTDGNGRTARALFYWSMLRSGYALCEFVTISHVLRKAPIQYAQAYLHTETDQNDATYFVLHQLEVLAQAIEALRGYVREKTLAISKLRALLCKDERFNERQLALLSHALANPDAQYTVTSHARSHQIVRQTARTDLRQLVEHGLLQATKVGKTAVYLPTRDLEERLQGFDGR